MLLAGNVHGGGGRPRLPHSARSGGPCRPLARAHVRASSWSPEPSQGALATHEVCLSAETESSGTPSQSVGEDSPAPHPVASTAETTAPLWNLSVLGQAFTPPWTEEAN